MSSTKMESILVALRRENNQYMAAIANVSVVVGELAAAVEVLQRQLGGCNVAATQALRAAGGGEIAAELSWIVWMLAGIGLLLLVKSPVMSVLLLAWGSCVCLVPNPGGKGHHGRRADAEPGGG